MPDSLRSLLPPALLLVVAGAHFALAQRDGLDPWKGGGFGMFSTAEDRHLHVFLEAPGGDRPLAVPDALADAAERAAALPSEARLRRLAEALRAGAPAGAGAVRLEVWATLPDPVTLRPVARRLRTARADAGARGPGG